MCLIVHNNAKPKTAEKDIITYKVVKVSRALRTDEIIFHSWGFPNIHNNLHLYEIGKTYTTTIGPKNTRGKIFCFKEECIFIKDAPNPRFISEGFHSCTSFSRLETMLDSQIMECIIPKGSEYYEGVADLIVSNKIKPIKLL